MFSSFFYALSLGLAVSLDALAAGMAYGIKNIKIPFSSLCIVGAVTCFCTALSMIAATMLSNWIDTHFAIIGGSLLLIAIGAFSLFQEYFTRDVKHYHIEGEVTARKLTFAVGKLVISIMARPESADFDESQSISKVEAFFLGLALGVDNMVATFAAALMGLLPLYTPLIMAIIQMVLIISGIYASNRFFTEELKSRFPYLPGAILILIGLFRLK
ncbi:sporulation membrane protein YtaF [Anaerospora sp.]|jgi:putative sporulation protein YtaF|uniref:sporulation membrane protein YtaF n=1 Tax=Anaerospora sp. TaxID=1960278 RepID=UPI002898FD70|nr:sporulation membrane protein YtaF [Anaerospora sp.]MDF2928903.1 mntP 1 [Anaerospora sp.]